MKQALLLSLFGFLPGLIGGVVLYRAIQHFTQILMIMTLERWLFIFALTVVMCALAGLLAVRKVLRADPRSSSDGPHTLLDRDPGRASPGRPEAAALPPPLLHHRGRAFPALTFPAKAVSITAARKGGPENGCGETKQRS
jgi:hypothetical protein